MPRVKSTPVAKRPLTCDACDNINCENCDLKVITESLPKRVRNKRMKRKGNHFNINDEFNCFLSKAAFYVTINVDSNESQSSMCRFGSFSINIKPEDDDSIPVPCADDIHNGKMYLYVCESPFECRLYYECTKTHKGIDSFVNLNLNVDSNRKIDFNFLQSLTSSVFSLSANLIADSMEIETHINLEKISLKKIRKYSDVALNVPNVKVQTVMHCLFDAIPPVEGRMEPSTTDLGVLYARIKQYQETMKRSLSADAENVQHNALKPQLRPYQMMAVRWMLKREKLRYKRKLSDILYDNIKLKANNGDDFVLRYNKFGGFFLDNCIYENDETPEDYILTPPSGILADEMGLGKTIEVLACVLCNQKSDNSVNEVIIDSSFFVDETFEHIDSNECKCGRETYFAIESSDSDSHINNKKKIKKKLKKKRFVELLMPTVRCTICGSHQHPQCMNFDTNKYQNYYCAHCWVREGMPQVQSRATLIVAPQSIAHQWEDEIMKHVNCENLNIYVYSGVASSKGYVQPYVLADNDIVLITYETLREELKFVDLSHSSRLRNPKRFNATPSPLLAINWWRICLDEAQMVESASSKVAQMALRLSADHRWCITGTPIQRSINDLYGLLLFIGEEPYYHRLWWETVLFNPYCEGNVLPLVEAISDCFWKTSKDEVWDQLGIPLQNETVTFLDFSPVEKHFYMRQHNECAKHFNISMTKFANLDIKLKALDRHTVNVLMTPLLKLRQACCHPQAIRGKFLPLSKKTMTMEDLLNDMIHKTQYECEEEHRKLIAAINGIAGIHIIKEEHNDAINRYRIALNSIDNYQHKDLFRTDKLQQYHTLHNLAELLECCGIQQKERVSDESDKMCDIPLSASAVSSSSTTSITIDIKVDRTLRDEFIRFDAQKLKHNYLSKELDQTKSIVEERISASASVDGAEKRFVLPESSPWWNRAINWFSENDDDEHNLIFKIKDTLEQHNMRGLLGEEQLSSFVSISNKFSSASGLQMVVMNCLRELTSARKKLKDAVVKLSPMPSDLELNQAIDCHLRPDLDKDGYRKNAGVTKCRYCVIHEKFNNYESKLYYFSQTEKSEESVDKKFALMEKLRRGTWGDSEPEQALKVILTMYKNKFSSSNNVIHRQIIDDGNNCMKYFEVLKKEFRALRAVWMHVSDFVAKIDELNMATMKLRLRHPNEPRPEVPVPYILEPASIDTHLITLKSDETIAKNALLKKLAHLYFLQNLSKANAGRKGGSNPEACPICQSPMGTQWAVLECGHSYCVKCIEIMITQYKVNCGHNKYIKCAMCRNMCLLDDILYVDSKSESDETHDEITVNGSLSTKVEEIIRCLLKIERDDPNAKSLVFSSWKDVLKLISMAMDENSIKHEMVKSSSRFADIIDKFKYDNNIRALLMPIHSGSKGLNLIEATHVILVEPTLNPANELQAVGRVHRIGQTKPTFVHRFVVRNTIEERIYEMFSAARDNDSPVKVSSPQFAESNEHAFMTLNDIRKLFEK